MRAGGARGEVGMARYRVALWLAMAAIIPGPLSAGEGAKPRAVLELFTSQGCSACPPADKLIGEFANDPSLVVMSLPIDYWDYLGWKDTLAQPRHSARQRAYAIRRGDREVYTPQVVVNGLVHVLGSDKDAIERTIWRLGEKAAAPAFALRVSIVDDRLTIAVPAGRKDHPAEIWLCVISKRVPVEISRGENRGRMVTYHNVVRRWIHLGSWSGPASSWTLSASELAGDDADQVAVIVQNGSDDRPGLIIGAALATLK
jgi:hypothetical protein